MLAVVLIMQNSVGAGEPGFEHRPLRAGLAARTVGVAADAKPGLGKIGVVIPDTFVEQMLQPGSIATGRRPEDPVAGALGRLVRIDTLRLQGLSIGEDPSCERIDRGRLIEGGNGAHRRVDQVDQPGKSVAEKPRYAQGNVDPRPVEHRGRHDLEPGHPSARPLPYRLDAHQRQAPGRHRRRRYACSPCPRPTRPRAPDSCRVPGHGARPAMLPISSRAARRPGSAPRGCRPNRNYARSAGPRGGRGSARRTGRASPDGRRDRPEAPPFPPDRIA